MFCLLLLAMDAQCCIRGMVSWLRMPVLLICAKSMESILLDRNQQQVYMESEAATAAREQGLEFEVYKQGMFKTELCNKWKGIGECPFGEHCQFAHEIAKQRPVIHHPRYKTEICRMFLAGEACPYGHYYHFRHALPG